ncbi:MAG: acetoacetyl-CoA reductase [Alphaproteobacteria bacterium]|nr:MAG: acetoacetyl-CoA reductase [Alphaproteobacteria bacterium]
MTQRLALVTGGTRGIGAALSKYLKADGHVVAATYHSNDEAAQKFSKESGIHVFKWDVGNFDACKNGVAKIEADLKRPIEVLVNNAGITQDTTLHKMTPDQWQKVIETNLTSCFNMCRNVIEGMRTRSWGRIINIGSVNGRKGQFGQTNYSAAKSGILGFTRSLALESAAKGITVNAVAPGYINTEMVQAVAPEILQKIVAQIPANRLGTPEDVADLVVWLASDKSSFVNGATFDINGGQYMV